MRKGTFVAGVAAILYVLLSLVLVALMVQIIQWEPKVLVIESDCCCIPTLQPKPAGFGLEEPTFSATEFATATATQQRRSTPVPPTATQPPTATSVPPTATQLPPVQPTPTKEWHQQPLCNRGGGNGIEGCDPGNSGGKPGQAGEGNDG